MLAETTGHCPHCDASVVGDDAFCCSGCEMAYAIVNQAGLSDYYQRRELPGARPAALKGAWDQIDVSKTEGSCQASLVIDGLRCSSCTWVVEHLLERTDGVQSATVSYATGRTHIAFDPEVTSLRKIAETIASIGYAPRPVHAPEPLDDLLPRLGVAAFATANLMLLAVRLYAVWADGMEARFQTLFQWGSLILATPIALYSAAPFFQGAWRGLRAGAIGMDLPIAIAIAVLYSHGLLQTLLGAEGYLDSLGMLVTLLLVGRVLERRGRRAAADAAAAIAAALPLTARRRTADGVEDVPVSALQLNDIVELGVGDEVPADGNIVHGAATVQMAILTGESAPASLGVGDALVAGASVISGAVSLRVDRVGADTLAMRMADAVRDATDRPLPPNPVDRLAPLFTVATLVTAVVAGGAWTLLSGPHRGIEVGVAVLVVACPCALGLSVPLSVASGLGALARRGVVLRDGGRLLALADVRTLALDKTGTLTSGQPTVLSADDDVLRFAAALERSSRHPIANALLAETAKRGLAIPIPTDVHETPGVGMSGLLNGVRMTLRSGGPGCVLLSGDNGFEGLIRLGDQPRDDASEAMSMLAHAGVRTVLLSGDNAATTATMGERVGASEATGGLTPADKAAAIRALQASGPVAFVGDGLNDGEALAAADVGLAMHTGVTSSLLLADAVVTQAHLRPIVAALAGARATQTVVRSNLRRALFYNITAVTFASFGLVNPLVAAILMPLSSAWVIVGALSVDRKLAALEASWTS